MAIALLGILMLAGHVIRAKVAILRRLFLPASLIAGLLGLALLNLFKLIPGKCSQSSSPCRLPFHLLNIEPNLFSVLQCPHVRMQYNLLITNANIYRTLTVSHLSFIIHLSFP